MMERPKYEIDIFWSEEDEGYVADVLDLEYCSAWGETDDEQALNRPAFLRRRLFHGYPSHSVSVRAAAPPSRRPACENVP